MALAASEDFIMFDMLLKSKRKSLVQTSLPSLVICVYLTRFMDKILR